MHRDYGYCVKCRKMTKTRDARYVTTTRGRRMLKGVCSKCKSNKTKFIKQQKGGDFTSSLTARTARIKLPWAKFPGELHIPGHSFTGPGTRLDMRLNSDNTPKSWSTPINRVDGASYRHDLEYAKHSDVAKRNEADRKMIRELDSIKKPTLRERAERSVVKRILKTKVNFGL